MPIGLKKREPGCYTIRGLLAYSLFGLCSISGHLSLYLFPPWAAYLSLHPGHQHPFFYFLISYTIAGDTEPPSPLLVDPHISSCLSTFPYMFPTAEHLPHFCFYPCALPLFSLPLNPISFFSTPGYLPNIFFTVGHSFYASLSTILLYFCP